MVKLEGGYLPSLVTQEGVQGIISEKFDICEAAVSVWTFRIDDDEI